MTSMPVPPAVSPDGRFFWDGFAWRPMPPSGPAMGACYRHDVKPASGSCLTCGKHLCKECLDLFSRPTCNSCAEIEARKGIRKIRATFIVAAGVGLFFALFGKGIVHVILLVAGFIVALAAPIGWRALNKVIPHMFLELPVVGWIMYFGIKLGLAIEVGIVALPFALWRMRHDYRDFQLVLAGVASDRNNGVAATAAGAS